MEASRGKQKKEKKHKHKHKHKHKSHKHKNGKKKKHKRSHDSEGSNADDADVEVVDNKRLKLDEDNLEDLEKARKLLTERLGNELGNKVKDSQTAMNLIADGYQSGSEEGELITDERSAMTEVEHVPAADDEPIIIGYEPAKNKDSKSSKDKKSKKEHR